MDIRADTKLSRNPDIVFSEIDGEVVMMSADFETYFGMESCGARIWAGLERETTFAALCERLVREFDVAPERCAEEARAFLLELCERGLAAAE